MSRIALIDRNTSDPSLRKLFDAEIKALGNLSNFSRGMAYIPEAVEAFGAVHRATRIKNFNNNPQLARYQQFAIIRTAAVNGPSGEYCWTHQIQLSEDIGITPSQFAAASGDFESSTELTEVEKLVIRWAEAVTQLTAYEDDKLFAQIKEHFSDQEIVETALLICLWNWSNRFIGALRIPVEPPAGRLTFFPEKD